MLRALNLHHQEGRHYRHYDIIRVYIYVYGIGCVTNVWIHILQCLYCCNYPPDDELLRLETCKK